LGLLQDFSAHDPLRVEFSTAFYAAFRPCFAEVACWPTGIPFDQRSLRQPDPLGVLGYAAKFFWALVPASDVAVARDEGLAKLRATAPTSRSSTPSNRFSTPPKLVFR